MLHKKTLSKELTLQAYMTNVTWQKIVGKWHILETNAFDIIVLRTQALNYQTDACFPTFCDAMSQISWSICVLVVQQMLLYIFLVTELSNVILVHFLWHFWSTLFVPVHVNHSTATAKIFPLKMSLIPAENIRVKYGRLCLFLLYKSFWGCL